MTENPLSTTGNLQRKGANGVVLKKFESVMFDIFSARSTTLDIHIASTQQRNSAIAPSISISVSSQKKTTTSPQHRPSNTALEKLTPRYTILPPCLNDKEKDDLTGNAKKYWKSVGLISKDDDADGNNGSAGDKDSKNSQGNINDSSTNVHQSDDAIGGQDDESKSSIFLQSPWPFDEKTSLPACGCVRSVGENFELDSKIDGSGKLMSKNSVKKAKRKRKDALIASSVTSGAENSQNTHNVGNVNDIERAWRKEMQLSNIIQCVLALLPDDSRWKNLNHCQDSANNDAKFSANAHNARTPDSTKFRIVDFAGGTGHLAVPLALLLPHCEVVCVDLKKRSLDLLHHRVDSQFHDSKQEDLRHQQQQDEVEQQAQQQDQQQQHNDKLPHQSNSLQQCGILPNLFTYHGSIQSYPHSFDIGVSLHACGEASDWTLRKCLNLSGKEGRKDQTRQKASWVICGCCCGKLRRDAGNPYVFQSTGGNEKGIVYPQSRAFQTLGNGEGSECDCEGQTMTPQMFDELARAADYSELGDVRKPRNACRRAAKSLVEWDRLLFAKECMGVQIGNTKGSSVSSSCDPDDVEWKLGDNKENGGDVVLTRMVPWESTTKNDIIIGWSDPSSDPYRKRANESPNCLASDIPKHSSVMKPSEFLFCSPPEDPSCHADFEVALKHLFGSNLNLESRVKGVKDEVNEATMAHILSEAPSGIHSIGNVDQNDWTAAEEEEIRSTLESFFTQQDISKAGKFGDRPSLVTEPNENSMRSPREEEKIVFRFPKKMGSRKRKLVHYVAEKMELAHWCEGKKDSEKIVAVALRR